MKIYELFEISTCLKNFRYFNSNGHLLLFFNSRKKTPMHKVKGDLLATIYQLNILVVDWFGFLNRVDTFRHRHANAHS